MFGIEGIGLAARLSLNDDSRFQRSQVETVDLNPGRCPISANLFY